MVGHANGEAVQGAEGQSSEGKSRTSDIRSSVLRISLGSISIYSSSDISSRRVGVRPEVQTFQLGQQRGGPGGPRYVTENVKEAWEKCPTTCRCAVHSGVDALGSKVGRELRMEK